MLLFTTLNISTLKSLDHVNIDSKNPPYFIFNNVNGQTAESNGDKYLVLLLSTRTKKNLKSIQNFGMKLKIKLKE